MTFRKKHLLTSGSKVTRPSRVVFVDTETRQTPMGDGRVKHKLRLGYALYCKTRRGETLRPQDQCAFWDNDAFWDWLESTLHDKTKTLVVSHNLNYDLPVLHAFRHLAARGFELTGFYTKGMTNIFRWRRGSCKLDALDNGNFFAGRLATWGEVVGYPKLAIDFETSDDDELLTYCQRDVEIMLHLWRHWLSFLDEHQCGDFKPTVASTAFGAFRHRFMPADIWVHGDELAISLERDAYKGGRVEVMYQGARKWGPFYYLDVNNMYGYVMRQHQYPTSLFGAKCYPTRGEFAYRLRRYAVVARVALDTDDNPYPLSVDGHTAYPTGRFVTTLTTPELQLARDRGWLRAVYAMAWYNQAPLFADYVDYFYRVRKAYDRVDNRPMSKIAKLLINSLYGKFGQRGIDQWVDGECDPETSLTVSVYTDGHDEPTEMTYLGGQIIHTLRAGEGWNSFPAIAAHVTAYARLHLWSLIGRVPVHHRYYCDTDSLIVDATGLQILQPFLNENELGALKIERQSPFLIVNAPKDYCMADRVRIKGVKDGALQIAPNVYQQTQWSRLAGMLRAGDATDYTTRTVTKVLARSVHSGHLQASGFVRPFRLPLE